MSNFPFKDPVHIRKLDRDGIEELLRMFEDAWNDENAERITSAQFYDRYARGEIDSMFAMAWASYYEAFRRLSRDDAADDLVKSLVA